MSLRVTPEVGSDLQYYHQVGWMVFSGKLAPSYQNWVFAVRLSGKALLAEDST